MKSDNHVIDRIIDQVLAESSSDLMSTPIHSAVARLAAERIREGIRLRIKRGQPVEGQLADVERLGDRALQKLCLERIWILTHEHEE